MEGKSVEINSSVQQHAAPSVAKLAGKFNDQSTPVNKELPHPRPIRRKPPCSLPLHVNKTEPGHNGEEKATGNAAPQQKVKVKSSPLIEKLQANLALGALLPGGPPKSPGLKGMPSPFNSPPSTPNSPNVQSRSSESDEAPVSFEQPPEGHLLQSYVKVRTRGSVKRRPPSRRFRKSQTDMGDEDLGSVSADKENGGKSEEGEEVFEPRSEKSPEPTDQSIEIQITSDEKLSGSKPSTPENVEEKAIDGTNPCKEAPEEKPIKESTEQETEMDTANAGMATEHTDKQETEKSQAMCQEPAASTDTVSEQENTGTGLESGTEQSKPNTEEKDNQAAGN